MDNPSNSMTTLPLILQTDILGPSHQYPLDLWTQAGHSSLVVLGLRQQLSATSCCPISMCPFPATPALSTWHLATHGWGKMLWWLFFIVTCRELVETYPISEHLRAFPEGLARGASWTQEATSHVLGPRRGKRRKSPSSQLNSPQCQSLSWAEFPDKICWRFLSKRI